MIGMLARSVLRARFFLHLAVLRAPGSLATVARRIVLALNQRERGACARCDYYRHGVKLIALHFGKSRAGAELKACACFPLAGRVLAALPLLRMRRVRPT